MRIDNRLRVIRGGSWYHLAAFLPAASFQEFKPTIFFRDHGFRTHLAGRQPRT